MERLASPITNIIRGTQERVHSLLNENPITKATQWMESKLKKFVPFLFNEKKPEAVVTPPVPSPVLPAVTAPPAAPEVAEKAPAPDPASSPPAAETSAPSESFQEVQEAEEKKLGCIMDDFAKITQQLRPAMKRNDTLDAMARHRMATMKETRVLEHDVAYLQQNKCAENILSGNYETAEAIAKEFMRSEKHRPNMLGSYKNFGLAMDRVLAKEKNEKTGRVEEKWQYFFVILFNEGAEAKPMPPVQTIPAGVDSAASIDLQSAAFAALEENAKEAGFEITHQPNEALMKQWVSEAERSKGTTVETFQTAEGKKANYIVRKNPPTLTQLGDRGPMGKELLFSEFVEHFKEALAEEKEIEVVGLS